MKNKIFTLFLTICMTVAYIPITSFAMSIENNISDEEQKNEFVITEETEEEITEDIEETEEEKETKDIEVTKEEETKDILSQMENLSDANIDFSSKRLIVKGLKKELNDEPVIANLDGVYLLQYETLEESIEAYYRLSEISDFVEFDGSMTIASEDITRVDDENVSLMTEEENPFIEVEELNVNPEKYNIAVIDTGATNADKMVSVLGDDGKDNNGHGQKMIDIIKTYAPNSKVLSIKAINNDGIGTVSSVYAAIKLAMDENVDIINLSISALATEDNFIIEEVIKEAQDKGITVVGAAGNNGIDASLTIPGKIDNAVIVGAANLASNTGKTVDYIVNTSSSSYATAIVSGLLASDTLKNYEIKDKLIILNDKDEDTVQIEEQPSDLFKVADGSYSQGQSISYRATHVGPSDGGIDGIATFTFPNDSEAIGTCAQLGVSLKSSGSATVQSRISNDSRLAKMVYYLVYELKYWQTPTRDQSIYGVVPGVISSTVWKKGYLVEAISQLAVMGRSSWLHTWGSNNVTAPKVADWYESFNVSSIHVPDNFEMYYCVCDGAQNFTFWKFAQNSKVTMHKVSAEPIPDYANEYYSLENARYQLLKEDGTAATDKNGNTCIFTTDANGKARQTFEVSKGKYKIKELEASKGFKIDTDIQNRIIDLTGSTYENSPYDAESVEKPETVKLKIHKETSASGTDIVANNPIYKLQGITFAIYGSQADAQAGNAEIQTFTIGSNGNSEEKEIYLGNYYLVETSVGNGYLMLDKLKKSNGGTKIIIDKAKTITIN